MEINAKRCNDCVFHHWSMEVEDEPDYGLIQELYCDTCGDEHQHFIYCDCMAQK